MARFTQPDTIVPGAGNPQAWNRYAYTLNNPVNLIDPDGHEQRCAHGEVILDGQIICMGEGGGGQSSAPSSPPSAPTVPPDPTITLDDLIVAPVVGSQMVFDRYMLGWENFGSAWSILNNNNASFLERYLAYTYMVNWVGAHAMFTLGVAGLACVAAGPGCVAAVEGALGIGNAANIACGGDACAGELNDTALSIERGISVIGRYPDNKILAEKIGGSYLNVRMDLWNSLGEVEQWALNKQWLQDAIIRGDIFQLASDISRANPGTGFLHELNYLFGLGYTIVNNNAGSFLIPPMP